MNVFEFPLVKITIGFVLGIILQYYLQFDPSFAFYCVFFTFFIVTIAYFLLRIKTKNTLYFGICTYFLALNLGVITQITHTDFFQKSNYSNCKEIFDKPHLFSITIREKLRSSVFNDRYIAIVNQVDSTVKTGRILINISNDSVNNDFEIGSHLQIKAVLYPHAAAKNPNQFDYGEYLANKQIYAQLFTDKSKIIVSSVIHKDVWYYTSKFRSKIIQNLEKTGFNRTELNVVIALLLGQQQDISPEIMRDYQFAGAVHILSVSGLHIGFILIFLTKILSPIPQTKRGSFVKLLIILFSLFSFGFIAGLVPSVLRSVTMFSFVAIGIYLRRSTNIYNTLLVSALIILLFQPAFVFDVGFQLSYLALFFILWLQPLLAKIWIPKNTIINYFWEILTVSFAAQIGTLPLSIYYFHQFPGLFFVTNLVIIPFLTLIMAVGVLVMVLAAIDYLPVFIAKMLEYSVFMLNRIINIIASFEHFIFQDIPCNWKFLIVLYLLIFTTIIWFKKPSFERLSFLLISIIVVQILYITTDKDIQNQSELVIFNTKGKSLISIRKGKNVWVYTNDAQLTNSTKNQNLRSYLVGNFSHLTSIKRLPNTLYFNENKILIIDSLGIYQNNFRPDVLVLTQSTKINLERLLQRIKPKIVVADASNFKTVQQLWKRTCHKQKIPFQATAEKGFFKI